MITSLHIGTVVKNSDYGNTVSKGSEYLGRVKVAIPGMTRMNGVEYFKAPGASGDLNATAIKGVHDFEVWAYVVSPMAGESSMSKYNNARDASSLADGNDIGNFNNPNGYTTPPAAMFSSMKLDGHSGGPGITMSAGVNPYGNCYVTENHSNSGKGMFGIPSVGAKVLVGFLNGSRSTPIILGKIHAGSEMEQIYGVGTAYPDYPNAFENTHSNNISPPTSALITTAPNNNTATTTTSCGPITTTNAVSLANKYNSLQSKINKNLSIMQTPGASADKVLTLSTEIDNLRAQATPIYDCLISMQGQIDASSSSTRIDVLKLIQNNNAG